MVLGRQPCGRLVWRGLLPIVFAGVAVLPAALHAGGLTSGGTSLVGTWSFDGRQACRAGPAWILAADGTYSEVILPDRRPRATGRWRERGDTICYSLARSDQSAAAPPLNKRMRILERSPARLVALGGRRVRHVMHRCP